MIQVELIRAWPGKSEAIKVVLADGAIVDDALTATGWRLDEVHVGLAVFGVTATKTTPLHDGDRVEILRGLQVDPKQARRARALRSGTTI